MPQPRDSKGHFLPTPGSLKSRVIQLEAQVARQSEEIQNRTISQKKAEDRARDLFTELRLIASAAGVGGHAEERWPSEIKRVINQLTDQQSLTADELGAALTEAETWRDTYGKMHVDYAALVRDIAAALKDLKQVTTERDGYAAELNTITEEANTQRKAAGEARAALRIAQSALTRSSESLKQERRAGLVETVLVMIGTAVVVGLAAWLVGRFGR